MFNVCITNFKSKEEAEEFINWYSGQGEQDCAIWMECRKEEGMDVRDFLPVDCIQTYQHQSNSPKKGHIQWVDNTAMVYLFDPYKNSPC